MTERLYYTDPYATRFLGHVAEQLTWEGRPAVVLDRTAFYPNSGGQPADRGMLGGARVLDVVVREEDGAVVHVVERVLAEGQVEGAVDWSRRFDHMQQHTGQHILSAAFERLFDVDTVGFHLGEEVSTIDLDVARLDSASAVQVEDLANRIVWEDGMIDARFVSSDELATLPLRRPPAVEGPIRIIEIAGLEDSFDVNPCGGTHVARAGEIGLIKIVRLDYRGDETRVEFVCGNRALHDYRTKNDVINQLAGKLTVGYWELDQAVERLQDEAKQSWQALRQVRKKLQDVEATELAGTAIACGPYQVVWRIWEGREPAELRTLAQELVQRAGVVALLVSVGERAHLCFACVEGADLDVAVLLRQVCGQLGGKGGGRPHFAQGSAPATDLAQVEAVVSDVLAKLASDS